MGTSDRELLGRIAAGDREAFAALYDRYAARVLGLLVQIVRDRDEAEDLLQVTFAEVWQRAASYDPARSRPEVWLFLIARSRALDQLDRRRRARPAPLAGEPAAACDPASSLERTEAARQL